MAVDLYTTHFIRLICTGAYPNATVAIITTSNENIDCTILAFANYVRITQVFTIFGVIYSNVICVNLLLDTVRPNNENIDFQLSFTYSYIEKLLLEFLCVDPY